MNPTLKIEDEYWIWQLSKILKRRKENGGRLGWYDYEFQGDKLVSAHIRMIKVKPYFWKKLYKHELGHHAITEKCKGINEARAKNAAYDADNWHGMLDYFPFC